MLTGNFPYTARPLRWANRMLPTQQVDIPMQVANDVRSPSPLPPPALTQFRPDKSGVTPLPLPSRILRLQRGAEIYADGDSADRLYKVISGTVRTCRLLPDGRRMIAQFALPGEIFGLDGLCHHRFFAEAVSDVVVQAFPRQEINRLVSHDPAAAQSWQAYTLERLAAAEDRFILLGRRTATERVAAFLLDLAGRGQAADGIVDLPMSRYDIADYLGLTAETVSRVLSTLRRKCVIADHGCHNLRILDRAALEEHADEEVDQAA